MKKNLKFTALSAFLLMLAGLTVSCEEQKEIRRGEGFSKQFTLIGQGILFGAVQQQQNVVIRTQGEWERFKTAIELQNLNAHETEIDFGKHMIIAVIDEERRTGGWDIVITSITEYPNGIIVDVVVTGPGYECPVPQIHTQPYHIVKTDRSGKRIEFEHAMQRRAPC